VEGLSRSQAPGATDSEAGPLAQSMDDQSGDVADQESRVAALCEELLARLPREQFDVAAVRLRYPVGRDHAMNSLLVQEL
jgi:dynein heavy chain